jgi:5-methylcytosine-specific restriction protein B
MAFPNNITKEDLLKAIEKIDAEGIPSDGDSQYYDVVYNDKRYPPKLIVSYANLFANGEILDRKSFAGGLNTPCFKLLEDNGFTIMKKDSEEITSYFDQVQKFLIQAESGQLGTIQYHKEFHGLKVKVSFGQGNPARIPWIAFLKDNQTVPNGIYPVYLFFKDQKVLVLAYGVSETTAPLINWNVSNSKTIAEYFSEHNLATPQRYGNSYIFKVYSSNKPLIKAEIDNDLHSIIDVYNKISFPTENAQSPNLFNVQTSKVNFDHSNFYKKCQTANFFIDEKLALRFIASLLTKPFVILTGLSGSGKSKLAQAFSMWLCESDSQYCMIPVGADWTNREPLLGFPNALEAGKYVKPDNRVLDLIIAAQENSAKPYFLILDEMNLSHVERYFADFLSVMESNNNIFLSLVR